MTREQFAFDELDARAAEDAKFPAAPDRGLPEWDEYAAIRGARAKRRKSMGYSRASADALVAWAHAQDAA